MVRLTQYLTSLHFAHVKSTGVWRLLQFFAARPQSTLSTCLRQFSHCSHRLSLIPERTARNVLAVLAGSMGFLRKGFR